MTSRASEAARHFQQSREALQRAEADPAFLSAVENAARLIGGALGANNKLMIAGNGGSAADAQHIAAEFLSRFEFDRDPLPALALTTDTSVLTAIGNDYGFEHVFARQVRGLGRKGDVLMALSTSGRSPNIVAALKAAREIGLATIGLTGSAGTDMQPFCDLVLAAPSDRTALIQQIHIAAAHAICGLVERDLFKAPHKS